MERSALALGAALGVVTVIVRQEIVLVIMGGVFVVDKQVPADQRESVKECS